MAAVRVGDKVSITEAQNQLAQIPTQQARRHVHFITGFEARWNGHYEVAEKEFLETLKINPKDTHALRELAQILVVREDYVSATRWRQLPATRLLSTFCCSA
ncbi:tetratricopeptide repeat protein [Paraherbaspirillum soli]|uniref:Type IV pilus biogenesis/stability protein PilW n=1 Tax=Paraherbaspirillum soli TaxID=631222 RepID=A0ABW0MFN0_9BURK